MVSRPSIGGTRQCSKKTSRSKNIAQPSFSSLIITQENKNIAKEEKIEAASIVSNKEKIVSSLSRKLRKRATPAALQETYILQNGPEVSQKVEEVKIGIAKKERATLLTHMLEEHKKAQQRNAPALKLELLPDAKGSDSLISPRTVESYSLEKYSFVEDYTMEDQLIDLFAIKPAKVRVIGSPRFVY